VNNKEQAQQAVRATRYAPDGIRGCGPRRAAKYGLERKEYVDVANDLMMVVVQVETQEAVDNLPEICSVDGVDAIFIGPSDLACSLGLGGDNHHPLNLETIAKILAVGKEHGMPVGIYGLGPEHIADHIRQGFQFVVVGSDMSLMMHGLRDILKRIGRD
jgi:2-keto-3-deoxy-L-rhamnonate aldolase RhmA